MINLHSLSISRFARLSRTTRDTLLHYDKIGLLSPESRGDNNYRYYSSRQLAIVNLIRTLQGLGMSLSEIRNLRDRQTPSLITDLFALQIEKIDFKIDNWIRARKLLCTLKETIDSTMDIDENSITIQFFPAEAIVLGDINDYSKGRTEYDTLFSFYQAVGEKYPDMDLNYPVWGIFSEERIVRGDWLKPDRYFFYNPEGHDRKPAALYAVGYTRGGYGECEDLYGRMSDYINANGFVVSGNAYEEYPQNEVCVSNPNNYLIRLMISVERADLLPHHSLEIENGRP